MKKELICNCGKEIATIEKEEIIAEDYLITHTDEESGIVSYTSIFKCECGEDVFVIHPSELK